MTISDDPHPSGVLASGTLASGALATDDPGRAASGLLDTGPDGAAHRLVLAHGAGAGMTSNFMDAICALLGDHGIAVTRFEFAYMAARRDGGPKRPPPKADKLMIEYTDVIATVRARMPAGQKLVIGGKSLGGRVASLVADDQFQAGAISGLVCLGYPFHAPAQPLKLRTAHLEAIVCPTLIVQGDRDPFGRRDEIDALTLSTAIQLHWIGDGDHDFGPRGASGFTRKGNLADAAGAVAAFIKERL